MFAHPVEDGPELRGYDPDAPDVRAGDAAWFTSDELKKLIVEAGAIPTQLSAVARPPARRLDAS